MTNQHVLILPDSQLYYSVSGSGQPMIFIHGNFNDHQIWDQQSAYFKDTYQVIRYDLRGYGLSSTPTASFSHVNDLLALVEHLKLKRVILVGSSMGGGIAMEFAQQYPELVHSLILVAPSVNGQRYPKKMLWKGFKNFLNLRFRGSERAIEAFIDDPYWSYFFPPQETLEARAIVINHVRNANNFCRFPPHLAISSKPSSFQRLHEIKAPTLIIISSDDHPFNVGTADVLSKQIPSAEKAMMHGGSHLPFVVKPEEFNSIIARFILKLRAAGTEPGRSLD